AEKEALVERIPSSQNPENWSELIGIQFFDLSLLEAKAIKSIEDFAKGLQKITINAYPNSKVSWRYIEKNQNDIIYEWVLHEPYKNIPLQHEIARIFLSQSGFHRIGYTRKGQEMNSSEREEWVKSLRQANIVKIDEAGKIQGLSLAVK